MAQFRNVGDDFVEYFIFLTENVENNSQFPKNLMEKIQGIVNKYSASYMWHLDEFKLIERPREYYLNENNNENLPPHLYGSIHYGENIEDEWFCVFLLFQITKELSDVCVRIVDSDGEFLLIEAANYLPDWAKPEICTKRVYIYKGDVHLIKPSDSEIEESNENEIKVEFALEEITTSSENDTKATPEIQNSIHNKINKFDKDLSELLHRTVAYVPLGVAAILKKFPHMISHAVRAFCNRDSIDMTVCRAMKFFPPEQCVHVNLTMTKFMFAMLTHSKFLPDRKIGWKLPPVNSKDYKRHLLGIKVACGFEILVAQAKAGGEIDDNNKAWLKFVDSLNKNGYFKETLNHSQERNNLLNEAKKYYDSFKSLVPTTSEIGSKILDFLRNSNCNWREDVVEIDETDFVEDSETWLEIDPKELDKILDEQYEGVRINSEGSNDVAGCLTKFLNHVSEVDGAEFPTETPERPPRRNKGKTKVSFAQDTKINFDPNGFSCAVQNMLDLVIPEDNWDLESDSDMSAYADDQDDNNLEGECRKMNDYMKMMDVELSKTEIGQSFHKKNEQKQKQVEEDFDQVEDFSPVDIDLNALKNILESYQMQMGEAGPASNMLGPMGINLDKVKDKKN